MDECTGERVSRAKGTGTGHRSKPAAARLRTPSAPAPGLFVVATPIGNLSDITLRALTLLAAADVIACEDTRVTGRLLKAHGIRTPMQPYHEHNAERVRPRLIERMKSGDTVALVADAGTPLVSDPGFKLVRAATTSGIAVSTAPGPSAALAALAVAGLPTDRFLFAGFLPAKQAARRRALRELAAVPATLVFYESPRRLAAALADMVAVLGDREAAVARELTKLHEEVRRDGLAGLATAYGAEGAPRGEIVVVVGPPAVAPAPGAADVDTLLHRALATMSVRDAATTVAAETGLPRREVYARALEIGRGGDQGEAKR